MRPRGLLKNVHYAMSTPRLQVPSSSSSTLEGRTRHRDSPYTTYATAMRTSALPLRFHSLFLGSTKIKANPSQGSTSNFIARFSPQELEAHVVGQIELCRSSYLDAWMRACFLSSLQPCRPGIGLNIPRSIQAFEDAVVSFCLHPLLALSHLCLENDLETQLRRRHTSWPMAEDTSF